MSMTWGEFKKHIDTQDGVTDDTEISWIDIIGKVTDVKDLDVYVGQNSAIGLEVIG